MLAENGGDRKLLGLLLAIFRRRGAAGQAAATSNMFSYFSNTLTYAYLPSHLGAAPGRREDSVPAASRGLAVSTATYLLERERESSANNVAGIFISGAAGIAQGTTLAFLFNPESDVFSLNGSTPELIENERFFVSEPEGVLPVQPGRLDSRCS